MNITELKTVRGFLFSNPRLFQNLSIDRYVLYTLSFDFYLILYKLEVKNIVDRFRSWRKFKYSERIELVQELIPLSKEKMKAHSHPLIFVCQRKNDYIPRSMKIFGYQEQWVLMWNYKNLLQLWVIRGKKIIRKLVVAKTGLPVMYATFKDFWDEWEQGYEPVVWEYGD